MINVYGASEQNAACTRRMYLERFPDWPTSSENFFSVTSTRKRAWKSTILAGGRPNQDTTSTGQISHLVDIYDFLIFPFGKRFKSWLLIMRYDLSFASGSLIEKQHFRLITIECCFTRNGNLNFHCFHKLLADEDPYTIRRSNFQQSSSLNLWTEIVIKRAT